jgi:hypothetical protein
MIGAYYAVKQTKPTVWWLTDYTDDYTAWSPDALSLFRARLRDRADAVRAVKEMRKRGYSNLRIVYVRVRPRSERLWMAERLAAWKPVVEAAMEWHTQEQSIGNPETVGNARRALISAVRAIPKEHKP